MSCKRNRVYRIREAFQVRCFCVPRQEKVWYHSCSNRPNGVWDRIAKEMTLKFEEASHPIFYCSEPLSEGDLKSKKGKQTIHFLSTIQRNKSSFIVLACNQLCICVAVCDLSDDVSSVGSILRRGARFFMHQCVLVPCSLFHNGGR